MDIAMDINVRNNSLPRQCVIWSKLFQLIEIQLSDQIQRRRARGSQITHFYRNKWLSFTCFRCYTFALTCFALFHNRHRLYLHTLVNIQKTFAFNASKLPTSNDLHCPLLEVNSWLIQCDDAKIVLESVTPDALIDPMLLFNNSPYNQQTPARN